MAEYTLEERGAVEILSDAASYLLQQIPESHHLRDGDDIAAAFTCMDLRRALCLDAAEAEHHSIRNAIFRRYLRYGLDALSEEEKALLTARRSYGQ